MKTEIRKAALLLSSLPRPLAARLLDRMPAKQVAALRSMADQGDAPTRDERKQAVLEFLLLSKRDEKPKPSPRRRIDPAVSAVPSFHFLAPLAAAEIIRLLTDELPQTQAAILAQLPAHLAAEVLALLPDSRRLQIVRRLSRLGPISNAALADMADVISHILKRRAPVRPNVALRSGDILAQLLANSSGSVHRILAEAVGECRAEADGLPDGSQRPSD